MVLPNNVGEFLSGHCHKHPFLPKGLRKTKSPGPEEGELNLNWVLHER